MGGWEGVMQVIVWDIVDAEVMWRNGGRDGGEEGKGDTEEEEENGGGTRVGIKGKRKEEKGEEGKLGYRSEE